MTQMMCVSSREVLMPDLFRLVRKTFPKGTLLRVPDAGIYQVIEDAVFLEKENRICVKVAPNRKSFIRKYGSDKNISRYVLTVDFSWLFRRGVEIIQKIPSAYEITDAEYHDEAGKERAYWDHEVKIADNRYVLVRFYETTGLIYAVEGERGLKVYDYDGRYYQEPFPENSIFNFVKSYYEKEEKGYGSSLCLEELGNWTKNSLSDE